MIPAFILFIAALILVLYFGLPMSLAMFAGFIIFLALGLVRGHRLKDLLIYSFNGAKDSLIVVRVMLVIGILTGLWRSSGTFAILTAWGLRVITPDLFILAAFILSCILSYALGTSFGTVSTLGIALITLARSGGADPLITAGAVMSGIHFGDRGSPSSSCLHLVTSLTGTNPYDNV
ncbi:MAG: sodium:proton antiporter, partial [Synergistaceae bacterium]|nr:sodium:proton antiporter [Synergistaceae bacterium]